MYKRDTREETKLTVTMAQTNPRFHEAPASVYQDFEPSFEWVQDQQSDTLLLMLKGFRKENLRVQIGTNRRLKLRGEEQISENKWRRFNKEFTIPSHSNTNGIKAKLEGGILYIRIPKSITQVKPETSSPTQPKDPTQEEPEKGEVVSDTKEMGKEGEDDNNGEIVDKKGEKKVFQRLHTTLYGLVGDIVKQKKLPNLVVAIFLFLGMGMYVINAIKSTFGGSTIQDP
ncbi:unnamed protein product [Sphenostylis stenocarpa]|uniref:SHSP domain-containing protein n=1 Tax=Sphenostylis stenocarpa TaxID=92480 RepID=A0AA86SV54_9FABA|nr:unnamed protein product [Sphenostylis stenocarpa]